MYLLGWTGKPHQNKSKKVHHRETDGLFVGDEIVTLTVTTTTSRYWRDRHGTRNFLTGMQKKPIRLWRMSFCVGDESSELLQSISWYSACYSLRLSPCCHERSHGSWIHPLYSSFQLLLHPLSGRISFSKYSYIICMSNPCLAVPALPNLALRSVSGEVVPEWKS